MEKNFDLIVIGAGPGGYTAAIKAAKLGLSTAIVESGKTGGTCLNRGCIPTKAMLHSASLFREMKNCRQFGISADNVTPDYPKILDYKNETIDTLVSGIDLLLKANGVTVIKGRGLLLPEKQVKVLSAKEPSSEASDISSGGKPASKNTEAEYSDSGKPVLENPGNANPDGIGLASEELKETVYSAENIILAAGSVPARLPIAGMELDSVLTSDQLFELEEMPESLTIIGGGVIGAEFAEIFSALGCKVTIIEALPKLLANLDKEISQNLKIIMKKRGVDIHTSARLTGISKEGNNTVCSFVEKDKEYSVESQYVLCAVGRKPASENLLDSRVSLDMEKGFIIADEYGRTSIPGIYAIGDLVKGIQLAHVAAAQGITAVEHISGRELSKDMNVVPSCIYTEPEITSAGITEEEAKAGSIPVKTGKFIMSANGKSLISKEERGFIKIVAHEESGRLLGAQMMCARATDMVGEMVTAISSGMTVSQLIKGIRAHPTYNEAVGEALEELEDGAIHVAPKKRK